jgi:zinc protease
MRATSLRNGLRLPGPEDIHRTVLPNGITVLIRENFESPSVALNGYMYCGSLADPEEKLGLSSFTALGLTRGTQKHTFHQFFDLLESCGASLGFNSNVHRTSFGGHALAEDLPLLVNLLSECIFLPTFPRVQMEQLRAQLLTGLMIRDQDTEEMASLVFDQILFKDHPFSRPEDGFPETIRAITLDDLRSFQKGYYRPDGMVIAIVGAIRAAETLGLVENALGTWKVRGVRKCPEMTVPKGIDRSIRKHVDIPGKSQTDLLIGTLGPSRTSEDFFPASLGNSILGQFGMMGRIGEAVRERAGLAYTASTSLNSWSNTGTWEVSAGVNPANVEKAIELVLKEIRRFTSEPVAKEELEDSKTNFIGRMPLSLESNAGMAASILNMERFDLGMDYLIRYPALVSAVNEEQVLAVAHKYLDVEKMVIVSAGTAEEKQ